MTSLSQFKAITDTNSIQNALTSNCDVYLPPGHYAITSPLQVQGNTTLHGAGFGPSVIQLIPDAPDSDADATRRAIEIHGSNVTIRDLSIMGPTPDGYVNDEVGIYAHGEGTTNRLQNIRIIDCEISNFGKHGVELSHVEEAIIARNRIHHIGYGAVVCLSCNDTAVNNNSVDSVGPASGAEATWSGPSNAYGISFGHLEKLSNPAHPAPLRCLASGNLIQNIPLWSGLDTHSGVGITFASNRVYNCKIGIHAGGVSDTDADGTEIFDDVHMRDIVITGNTVIAESAAHQHYGIVVTGRSARHARNALIANNIVNGYGDQGNDRSGAIQLYMTDGVTVNGNVVRNFAESGILFWYDNENLVCSGNQVFGYLLEGMPYGIRVREGGNRGLIAGNNTCGYGVEVRHNDPERYPEYNDVTTVENR